MVAHEILSEVSVDDLPGDLQAVAEVVGVKNTIKLADAFRGCSIYFRNIDNLLRQKRNEKICTRYDNGTRILDLAREYRLSTRQIESILSSCG